MSKFIVAIDSGCDFSIDLCKKYDIKPLFMQYEKEGELIVDTMMPQDMKVFYEEMAAGKVIRTGAINIASYLSFWESLLPLGLPILHITLGSAISGTYSNALLAREEFEAEHKDAKIVVVDSKIASSGIGLIAMEAVAFRDSDKTVDECAEHLEKMRSTVHALFTTDDLTYLYRGGRVKKTSMVIAHALGILPILHLNAAGELKVCDKCRGRKATYANILEKATNLAINPEQQTLYISHADNLPEATNLGMMLSEKLGFKNVVYNFIGSTIGAHTGPGLVAVFFSGKERE